MHWRRKWQLTPVFLPGESQGLGSLVSCRPWGPTESDTTEATQQQQQHCEPIYTRSVAKSCLTLWSHGLQHARLPCPSLSPRVCSNSCPLSWWCHPTISSSVIPFSSSPQYFLAWESFLISLLFKSGSQCIGALGSASVLPMYTQGWFNSELIGLISLLFKGLSGIFSSNTLRKHQFFGTQLSL